MGKFAKGCLITAAIFIVTGILIGMIVTLIGGRSFIAMAREHELSRGRDWGWNWNLNVLTNDLTVNDEIISSRDITVALSSTGIKELDISAGVCEFILQEWDEEDFGIEISGRGGCDYYVENGCLYVEGFEGVNTNSSDNEIRLSIPHGITYENVSFNIGAANAEISGVTADSLACSVGMGNVEMEEMAAEEVNMDAGMGSIRYEGQIEEDLTASCGMGNIELELEGSEEDYNYSISCAAGNITIDNESYTMLAGEKVVDNKADRDIWLDCGMGNMEIDFTD